jgi:hypothetical protein
VNTYRLAGRSVDALLSLKKLSDVSKEQYLNGVKQVLDETRLTPDELVAFARKRPRAFEKAFADFLVKRGELTSPATVALIRNSVMKFFDASKVPRRRDSDRGADSSVFLRHDRAHPLLFHLRICGGRFRNLPEISSGKDVLVEELRRDLPRQPCDHVSGCHLGHGCPSLDAPTGYVG